MAVTLNINLWLNKTCCLKLCTRIYSYFSIWCEVLEWNFTKVKILLEGHKFFYKYLFWRLFSNKKQVGNSVAFSENLNFIIKYYVLKIKPYIVSKIENPAT